MSSQWKCSNSSDSQSFCLDSWTWTTMTNRKLPATTIGTKWKQSCGYLNVSVTWLITINQSNICFLEFWCLNRSNDWYLHTPKKVHFFCPLASCGIASKNYHVAPKAFLTYIGILMETFVKRLTGHLVLVIQAPSIMNFWSLEIVDWQNFPWAIKSD